MSNIKIHINELGPVKDCDLILAPVMLFTGKSNLGKSYVNFLAYYVYSLFSSHRLDAFIKNKIGVDIERSKNITVNIKSDELRLWMEKDVKTFFQYLLGYKDIPCQIQFSFNNIADVFRFEYIEAELPTNFSNFYPATLSLSGNVISFIVPKGYKRYLLLQNMCQLLGDVLFGKKIFRAFLFPPGRASLLSGNFSNQSKSSRLGLYDIFLHDNDEINLHVLREQGTASDYIISQSHNLINGELSTDKDGIYLVLDNGNQIPLDAAASSVKELAPLLLWMQGEFVYSQSVCIEEPEAHLHPEMQIAVADLLAACINKGAYMQITTHSDYFMQRVNQLLKLGYLREKDVEVFNKLCEDYSYNNRCYLNPKKVNAYYFYAENGCTKIRLLEIGEQGIPMSTFFDAVDQLNAIDEVIDNVFENIK